MVDLLKLKGRMELNSIASELGIGPLTVESWSRILEKGGIVEVTYEMGKMYVSPLSMSPKDKENLKNRVAINQKTVTTIVEGKTEELHLLAQNLDDLKVIVQKANRLYTEKLPNIQAKLTEINNVYVQVERDKNVVIEIKNSIESAFNNAEKQMNDIVDKTKYLESDERLDKLNTAMNNLKDLSTKSKEYNEFIASINKNREKVIADMKSDIDQRARQLKEEIEKQSKDMVEQLRVHGEESKKYNESIVEQTKIAEDLMKKFNDFRKQKDVMVKNINQSFKDFNERYKKSYASVTKNMQLLEAHSNDLKLSISDVKQSFGSASVIFDFIKDIEDSIKKTDASITAMKDRIEDIRKEFNTLKNDKSKTLVEKDMLLNKMEKEAEEIEDQIVIAKDAIDKNLKSILSNRIPGSQNDGGNTQNPNAASQDNTGLKPPESQNMNGDMPGNIPSPTNQNPK